MKDSKINLKLKISENLIQDEKILVKKIELNYEEIKEKISSNSLKEILNTLFEDKRDTYNIDKNTRLMIWIIPSKRDEFHGQGIILEFEDINNPKSRKSELIVFLKQSGGRNTFVSQPFIPLYKYYFKNKKEFDCISISYIPKKDKNIIIKQPRSILFDIKCALALENDKVLNESLRKIISKSDEDEIEYFRKIVNKDGSIYDLLNGRRELIKPKKGKELYANPNAYFFKLKDKNTIFFNTKNLKKATLCQFELFLYSITKISRIKSICIIETIDITKKKGNKNDLHQDYYDFLKFLRNDKVINEIFEPEENEIYINNETQIIRYSWFKINRI